MRVDHETRTVYLRQSGLGTFMDCPEKARLEWFHGVRDLTSDAAAIGTACHYGIECNLNLRRDHGQSLSIGAMIELAQAEFERIHETEGIRYVQGNYDKALRDVEGCIRAWRSQLEPYVLVDDGLLLEHEFDVPLMWWSENDGIIDSDDAVTDGGESDWDVRLTGTIDLLDSMGNIIDWKTSGSSYKQAEKQRWAIQPTVYAHAAVESGLASWPVSFRYGVMVKRVNSEVAELVPVVRHPQNVEFLKKQVSAILTLWSRVGEDESWPLTDDHWLCSEKWCPAWSACKGSLVSTQHLTWRAS